MAGGFAVCRVVGHHELLIVHTGPLSFMLAGHSAQRQQKPHMQAGQNVLSEVEARFPEKLKFLFAPARYKVARGGRGSGKSWGFARALLIQGASQPTRVLCTREVQKSIQQSVHQLLEDQVAELGLSSFYEVLTHEIRGKNGSAFYFAGLSDQTADTLKSFEGVDIVWCEEAHSITERSWNILTPTIRKPNSEIWVSFNPELESDETFKRFIRTPQTTRFQRR